jgi:hypothetical protein
VRRLTVSYGQVDLENLRANALKSTAIETSRAERPLKAPLRNGFDKRAIYDILATGCRFDGCRA